VACAGETPLGVLRLRGDEEGRGQAHRVRPSYRRRDTRGAGHQEDGDAQLVRRAESRPTRQPSRTPAPDGWPVVERLLGIP
jgi:hypothetical protein